MQGFQILDSEDQLRLIKKLMKAQELDETRWMPREVQGFINSNKDEGRRPKHLKDGNDPTRRAADQAVRGLRGGLRALPAWSTSRSCCCARSSCGATSPALLAHYRQRFRHVLVDEFQDTNAIQYAWMKLLAGSDGAALRGRR